MEWISIEKTPVPKSGCFLVSGVLKSPYVGSASFVSAVRGDELGVMDFDGESIMYTEHITHWMPFPDPVVVT